MSVSELLFVLITFSALANGYKSENWENEELCGNTTPGQGNTSGEYVSPEHTISSFPNLYDCWYNDISIRKNLLYFFVI